MITGKKLSRPVIGGRDGGARKTDKKRAKQSKF